MTHYEVLGIPEGASVEQIKSAYRLKMREYHPDQFQQQPSWVNLQAEAETKAINVAYAVLGDAEKRTQYDFDLVYARRPKTTPRAAVVYGHIYKVVCRTNQKGYVGQTTQTPEDRWEQHKKDAASKRQVNGSIKRFHFALYEHGVENFVFTVIDTAYTHAELNQKECSWIAQFSYDDPKCGYNSTSGGSGQKDADTKPTPEPTYCAETKATEEQTPWHRNPVADKPKTKSWARRNPWAVVFLAGCAWLLLVSMAQWDVLHCSEGQSSVECGGAVVVSKPVYSSPEGSKPTVRPVIKAVVQVVETKEHQIVVDKPVSSSEKWNATGSPDDVAARAAQYHLDPALVNAMINDEIESGKQPVSASVIAQTIRELLERYNFDLVKALAAYSVGTDRVEQCGNLSSLCGPLSRDGGVPPEARRYVSRIVHEYNLKLSLQRKSQLK